MTISSASATRPIRGVILVGPWRHSSRSAGPASTSFVSPAAGPTTPVSDPARFTAEQRGFWAFRPVQDVEPPHVRDEGWPSTPLDRFILARLEEEGLKPAPRADKRTLIRRVTFDLTGLPPTPEEVDAFLKDTSADAYEKVVNRLLKSPRYGEHITRFWLDAARFGDTHGMHLDNYREMWPYRDWLINA